jgi:hypothetical protein
MMSSDLTLLLLLYYMAISIAAELLPVDYTAVLRRWWNKPFKRSRTSLNKHHPQRRSRFLQATPSPGHKPEKRQPEFRRARFRYGRGKSRCTRHYYYYYSLLLYKLSCGTIKPVQGYGRKIYACTGTNVQKDHDCFGTNDTSTETYDSDSTWIGIDSLSTYCITNSMHDFTEKPTKIKRLIKGINDTPAHVC